MPTLFRIRICSRISSLGDSGSNSEEETPKVRRVTSYVDPARENELHKIPGLSTKPSLLFLRRKGQHTSEKNGPGCRFYPLDAGIINSTVPVSSRDVARLQVESDNTAAAYPSSHAFDGEGNAAAVSFAAHAEDAREPFSRSSPVLVPKITVTPEVKTLEDGATEFWAAIEISTQLSRPLMADNTTDDMVYGTGSEAGEPLFPVTDLSTCTF